MLRLELIDISKPYPAVKANDNVYAAGRARRDPRRARRERRRQVDADEDHLRRRAARRRARSAGTASRSTIRNPHEARALGISMVFQHFSLFDTLTVGRERLARARQAADAWPRSSRAHHASVDAGLRPASSTRRGRCTRSSVGERQRVEIVRALLTRSEAADPRRADLGADAAGGRKAVRHAAPARRARAAASSTSATSSTRSARCATTARCCAAARSPASVDPRQETNASAVAA